MFSSLFVALALTATGVFGAPSPADTVAALKAAPAQVDRIKILDQDSDVCDTAFCSFCALIYIALSSLSSTSSTPRLSKAPAVSSCLPPFLTSLSSSTMVCVFLC